MLSIPKGSGALECFTAQILQEKRLFLGLYLMTGFFWAFAPSVNKQILSFIVSLTVLCAAWLV